MDVSCPSRCLNHRSNPTAGQVVRAGFYYRTSDRRKIQRYQCALCRRHFSQGTFSPALRQKKRQLNYKIYVDLASLVSQRRIARKLQCHRKTVARKLQFLGLHARHQNRIDRLKHPRVTEMQFDDLETIEHTKLKPLSVTLAVEKGSRFILGFEVSRMPAKGLLAKKSVKKYSRRKDERSEGRDRLFRKIKNNLTEIALIESDENPHYPASVRTHFPKAEHKTVKGQRGSVTGQGELKKIAFDPLFSLNHTCAMMRANINRLIRKTWCTTKKLQPLIDHIDIYVHYHNRVLI